MYPSVSSLFISIELPPEETGAPLELVTSEVTARSFRVSWSHAPGNVEKYRVLYYPASEGEPQEVNPKNTSTFTGLNVFKFTFI